MSEGINIEQASTGALRFAGWERFAKRGIDIGFSSVLMVLSAPLWLMIAAVIKASSRGPILFRWDVIGVNGHPFRGYKFRTMVNGADSMRAELSSHNEMTGPFFKMKKDPRVFPFGRILRKFSLDELPQLWSVLKGDMSLVGPRPTQIFEFQQLTARQRRRVQVKPGAVSSWIVSGKPSDFEVMIEQDLQYISDWSIGLDLRILAKALPYILLGKNT